MYVYYVICISWYFLSFIGTNFTLDELFHIHQSLKNWHFLLETFAKDIKAIQQKKREEENKDKINLPNNNNDSHSRFMEARNTTNPLLISTGFLKYPLELKKNFQLEFKKKNQLVYTDSVSL